MAEIGISSLSKKGQVTIPKEVRRRLRLGPGDRVVFVIQGDSILIRKALERRLSEILEEKPWPVKSLEFQRKMRGEWI
jgi:AbrB family looped-hinge helix DNA binding protein